MKNISKILILISAIVLAVAGVLIYIKTILDPPGIPKFKNQYEQRLSENLNEFKIDPQKDSESQFALLEDKIRLFFNEEAISDDKYNGFYSQLIGVYAPIVASTSLEKFKQPVWNESDHSTMASQINKLRNLTEANGNKKFMAAYPQINEQFTLILNIISQYQEAKRLSTMTSYKSLSDAQNKISRANNFKADSYLKNNRALMASLNSFPSKIEASHYRVLQNKVNSLANYTDMSWDSFKLLSDQAEKMVEDYGNNASKLYGISSQTVNTRTKILKDGINNYYNNASYYFFNL